jgi:F-type H+-transporting ATPase subunit gamma
MPSLSELRRKIKGVTSTRQITKAMKMVAGARFARANRQMVEARSFADGIEKILGEFLYVCRPTEKTSRFISIDGNPAPAVKKVGLVAVAGDKGLCGDFNNKVVREADRIIQESGPNFQALFVVGRKLCGHFRSKSFPVYKEHSGVFNRLEFGHADQVGQEILKQYVEQQLTLVQVAGGSFKSMIKQQVAVTNLLPIRYSCNDTQACRDMIYEPIGEDELLHSLIPFYVKARLYALLCESFTAELAARMWAMDNATNNADTLIDEIKLEMNKVRQAVITREIAEIIGTNEVVK